MTPEAERFNGWAAMLGFVAAVGAYVTTGQIIPGWCKCQSCPQQTKYHPSWQSYGVFTP